MGVKIGNEEIQALAVFERATGTYARDCIKDNGEIIFVVEPGKMGTAIGKGGINVKRAKEMLKKDIRVYEYSPVPKEMIKNMIPVVKTVEIEGENAIITIAPRDRSAVIGRNGKNIKIIKELLERHFNIKNLRLR